MTGHRLLSEPELSVTELPFSEDGADAAFTSRIPPRADRKEPTQAPWIEYLGGQWVVVKRPPRSAERRSFHAMRQHVDKLLEQGWSITGRDPVRLERHQRVKIVRGGLLLDG
ncbi:hypothetical protein [Pseudomonas sp. Q1-7]|uniref:hypothetical protein n=1 Tax=Pseudomonas sp. Q1-7 TaxID=3020843 RepID=UPI0023002959|nr:hypothetical protein [Pseudomonas sp. Q1-7]